MISNALMGTCQRKHTSFHNLSLAGLDPAPLSSSLLISSLPNHVISGHFISCGSSARDRLTAKGMQRDCRLVQTHALCLQVVYSITMCG